MVTKLFFHSIIDYSELFHPDNIKNFEGNGGKVSISLYNYWTKMGGPRGLALGLKTNLKVRDFLYLNSF